MKWKNEQRVDTQKTNEITEWNPNPAIIALNVEDLNKHTNG